MNPNQIQGKKIAYACFDWGFGHVTRSISIIDQLVSQGNEVHFIGDSEQVKFVQSYFPQLKTEVWEVPSLVFKGSSSFLKEGINNFFRIRSIWSYEQQFISNYVAQENIDCILSDHRYHFKVKGVYSIFITHQYHLPLGTPWLVNWIHKLKMKGFDKKWIIDVSPGKFAGKLSETSESCYFIGLQSRFKLYPKPTSEKGVLVVLSGPDAYAEQLLKLIQASLIPGISVISALEKPADFPKFVCWCRQGELPQSELDKLFLDSEWIISRNGYSTRMDLALLNKKGLLLATPGQLEQLYLTEIDFSQEVKSFTLQKDFLEAVKELFDRYSSGSNNS